MSLRSVRPAGQGFCTPCLSRRGTTLAELTVALAVLNVTLLTAFGVFYSGARLARRTSDRVRAEVWAAGRLEECRGWSGAALAAAAGGAGGVPPAAEISDLPELDATRRVAAVAGRPGLWEVTARVAWAAGDDLREEVRLTTWVEGGR
ncbi:MAG: hypothetical protein HZA54_14980 [Planctomycetes bacterium]|nr:hypothetical protein [Planctomycetota bacterium]